MTYSAFDSMRGKDADSTEEESEVHPEQFETRIVEVSGLTPVGRVQPTALVFDPRRGMARFQ